MEESSEATGGPGAEGMEAERETGTEKELTNWEKVVALVKAYLG